MSTTFLDGPAAGVSLMLKRTPKLLRVVEERGKWDALDQVEDMPKSTETIYVYELAEHLGNCHIRRSGGGGGFYSIATYRFIPQQPLDSIMRNTNRWKDWVTAYAKKQGWL